MKPVENWKSWTFIGSLILIAIVLEGLKQPWQNQERTASSVTVDRTSPIPQPETKRSQQTIQSEERPIQQIIAPRQITPEELRAERERFISRFMNERPSLTSSAKSIGVVAVDEKGKLNNSLTTQLAKRAKGDGIRTHTSLFTPEFVSANLFKAAFEDSAKPIEELELSGVLDALLLAQATVEYETNPSLENVITASMQLEVRLISITRRGESQSWTFNANGPGFRESDARKAAEERIIKQINNDTNFLISASR